MITEMTMTATAFLGGSYKYLCEIPVLRSDSCNIITMSGIDNIKKRVQERKEIVQKNIAREKFYITVAYKQTKGGVVKAGQVTGQIAGGVVKAIKHEIRRDK